MADETGSPAQQFRTGIPHSARVWNYWLGGEDNYAADRAAGDKVAQVFPDIVTVARTTRMFLGRAVRYLAGEAGVRQFLDIGTGLPTVDNTHEVAQRVAPDSRVVYVDNDPLVLAHTRVLLTCTPEGKTAYVDADMHEPAAIFEAASDTLDLHRPVALILCGVLGHVADHDEALGIARRLMQGLPAGSHLVLSDGVNSDESAVQSMDRYAQSGGVPYHLRKPDQIAGFFEGLELVEPGVVPRNEWRPDTQEPREQGSEARFGLCGVGRKP
ncbi:MAG: SAM-dependent methyltransferase [Actinomadura sp.]